MLLKAQLMEMLQKKCVSKVNRSLVLLPEQVSLPTPLNSLLTPNTSITGLAPSSCAAALSYCTQSTGNGKEKANLWPNEVKWEVPQFLAFTQLEVPLCSLPYFTAPPSTTSWGLTVCFRIIW